jgi:hypothetical protein
MSLEGLKEAIETEWIGAEIVGVGASCGSMTVGVEADGWDDGVENLANDFGFETVGVSPNGDTVKVRLMEE